MSFEIGCVYTKEMRYYLAVEADTLISAYDGEAIAVKPRNHESYRYVKSISVQDLCDVWNITMDRLDEISHAMLMFALTPDPSRVDRKARDPGQAYAPLIARILAD